MKLNTKIYLLSLMGSFSLIIGSCQNDESEVITPNTETLSKSAPLTNLLQRVAMTDPTTDNIIDSTDCFKIKLPVEVMVNDQLILVASEADFVTVEAAFDNSPNQYNTVDLIFPVTAIYPDNEEVMIGSESQFDLLANECVEVIVPVEEQPINCLSVIYPINIFTYNSEFQVADSLTFNNDSQLMGFLANLGPDDFYGIDYPISVINLAGETIIVNDNDALWSMIIQAIADCESEEPTGCEPGTSYFQTAYDSIKGMENVDEIVSMDALIHEYKFEILEAYRTICTIGYKGEEWSQPVNYTIEIEDQMGNIIYSNVHAFSSIQTEYINVVNNFGGEITLAPGVIYTIRRIVQPGEGSGIGTLIERSQNQGPQPPILPFTTSNMKIHSSRFYGGGGTANPDLYRVPFIDIIFKN